MARSSIHGIAVTVLSRSQRLLVGLVFWLALAWSHAAQATCTGPLVRTESDLPAGWDAEVRQLAARLAEFPGLDPCSTVRLFERAGVVFAQAELTDGRSARRRVEERSELVAVSAALLTFLPDDEPTPVAAPADTPAAPAPKTTRASAAASQAADAPEPVRSPRQLAVDLALGASVRLAGPPRYAGPGMLAQASLAIDAWLVGAWVRWDIRDFPNDQRNLPSDLDMNSLLVGGYFGYRVKTGQAAIDVLLGPNVLYEDHEALNPAGPGEIGGAFYDVSVAALLRLTAPTTGAFRMFLLLGGELYPLRAAGRVSRPAALPRLPTLAGTLAIGAAWSSR